MARLEYRTKSLFPKGRKLTPQRLDNSILNDREAEQGEPYPKSFPRRIVLELTNDCNLQCVMCGRFDANFKKTYFKAEWLYRLEPILRHVEEVTLMGWGEPTIHPDFVKMLEFIHALGPRIYFCTNGMTLTTLRADIFRNQVDIIAVSMDGSTAEKNRDMRRGADFALITGAIADLVKERNAQKLAYPYINFVTTLTTDTISDFPDIVRLAGSLGIEEAKAVYLTAFSQRMADKTLYNRQEEVRRAFEEALRISEQIGVDVKLPAIQGDEPSGDKSHKQCYQPWRDFFIGSDGFVRPCMSTALKFFHIDALKTFEAMWRHPSLVDFRRRVNIEGKMDGGCAACYQSSHANWNRRCAFLQLDGAFSPQWESEDGQEGAATTSD